MIELLNTGKGRIYGIVGSKDSGKTTALLQLIEESKQKKGETYCYFYHQEYIDKVKGVKFVETLNDMEQLEDSIIFVDEFGELFNIYDRHQNTQIKTFFGQMSQNNNIIVLCGLPNYFNGVMSAAVGNNWLLKSLNYSELVNGSDLKKYVMSLSGDFVGATRLNIKQNKIRINGLFVDVKYNSELDRKSGQINILEDKQENE